MTCSSSAVYFDWRLLEPGMVVNIVQNCNQQNNQQGSALLLNYTFIRIEGRTLKSREGLIDIERHCFVPDVGTWMKSVSRRLLVDGSTRFILVNILTIEEMVVSTNPYIREVGSKSYDESRRHERVAEAVGRV